MDLRERNAQVGVPLVGADDKPARLGDGEIHAGNPHVGLHELVAEVPARGFGQVIRIGRAGLSS